MSTIDRLVPRVMLEKETLERSGYHVDVLYRGPISWNIETFRGLIGYYLKALRESLKENIWAVHLTHISQIPLSPILKLKRKTVVYDAYERYSIDISEKRFKGWLKNPSRWLIEFVENWIIKFFVDAVLVVSTPNEYLHKRYRNYCRLTECLYNVPPLTSVFKGDFDSKFNRRPLKVAYIGVLTPQKGSRKFIPFARLLRERRIDCELHLIISMGSESEKRRLLSDIENFELSDFITVHGYMEYPSMVRFLYGCHVGLNLTPNTKRLSLVGIGSSRKNYTYMSAGMVVITTAVGQMAYVTEQENCGVIIKNLNDLDLLASVIERIALNRFQAIGFAKNGVEAIKKRYNWEKEQQKVLCLYGKLFGDK